MLGFVFIIIFNVPFFDEYDVYWKLWKVGKMQVYSKTNDNITEIDIYLYTSGIWRSFYNLMEHWKIVSEENFSPRFTQQIYIHGKNKGKWLYEFSDTSVIVNKNDTLLFNVCYRDVFLTLAMLPYMVPDTVRIVNGSKLYNFIPTVEKAGKYRKIWIKGRRSRYEVVYDSSEKLINQMIIHASFGDLRLKGVH